MDSDEPRQRLRKALAQERQKTLRVRFSELWPEIRAALAQGYSIANLYEVLNEQGTWPGSYSALRAYIAANSDDPDATTPPRPRRRSEASARPGPAPLNPSSLPNSQSEPSGQLAPPQSSSPYPPGFGVHPSAMDGPPIHRKGKRS